MGYPPLQARLQPILKAMFKAVALRHGIKVLRDCSYRHRPSFRGVCPGQLNGLVGNVESEA